MGNFYSYYGSFDISKAFDTILSKLEVSEFSSGPSLRKQRQC